MQLSDKAQQSLQKVITQFQSGDLSPVTQTLALTLPDSAPARHWTLSNRVLAYIQTGAIDCRGFQQWKDAGRSVKKGGRAGYILYPKTYTREEDGEKITILAGFGTVPVFGIDDTEGADIPAYSPRQLPPLMDLALILGIDVAYTPLPSGVLGFCTTDNSKIRLATHDERVFFHELSHALHNTFEKGQGGQDPHRETVAELTGCILMQLYGLRDTSGDAWGYISSYNSDPLKAIMQALGDVERILNKLFELIES